MHIARPEYRQIAVVDVYGRAHAVTGARNPLWCGHRIGEGYACAGNVLAGEQVVAEMAKAFEAGADESLAERLMRAVEAGRDAGGVEGGERMPGGRGRRGGEGWRGGGDLGERGKGSAPLGVDGCWNRGRTLPPSGVTQKVASVMTAPDRPRDFDDVIRLIRANELGEHFADGLHGYVQEK